MGVFYTHRRAYSPLRGREVHELAKFNDSSSPTEVYELWEAKPGSWRCMCPASFRPGHSGEKCKHPGLVRSFIAHGSVGWAFEPDTNTWIDMFPLPRGANGLLVDVRGEQQEDF